ncbi:MAG: DNA gyrase C-terminal beta-propeller domain-containing protein, partial [Planococcaceae bacterium]|nr:DNA gyrase C-terminal beta-propeller domain-containing protein [Planococcaceae bacterium]
QEVLVVTENGYGKRTSEEEYRLQSRGGVGIKTSQITEKTGHLAAVKTVDGSEDLMLITINGMLIRMDVSSISVTGRSTQGVRLIRLGDEELVATVAKVEKAEEEEEFDEDGEESSTEVVNEAPTTQTETESDSEPTEE